jgi:hypothetical protein
MGLAFEFARAELRIDSDAKTSAKLAKKIIELAKAGERDPDKLCDFRDRWFSVASVKTAGGVLAGSCSSAPMPPAPPARGRTRTTTCWPTVRRAHS